MPIEYVTLRIDLLLGERFDHTTPDPGGLVRLRRAPVPAPFDGVKRKPVR